MFELIGVTESVSQTCIGGDFETTTEEEVVALFTEEKLAKEYIEKARLKTPKRESFSGTVSFRENTLLAGCESAYVQTHYPLDVPVDPTL